MKTRVGLLTAALLVTGCEPVVVVDEQGLGGHAASEEAPPHEESPALFSTDRANYGVACHREMMTLAFTVASREEVAACQPIEVGADDYLAAFIPWEGGDMLLDLTADEDWAPRRILRKGSRPATAGTIRVTVSAPWRLATVEVDAVFIDGSHDHFVADFSGCPGPSVGYECTRSE